MAPYYITGASESDKPTALSVLKSRGYEAYDVDEARPVTTKWHNGTTRYVRSESSVKKEGRTSDFIATHSWKAPHVKVEELAKQADFKTIFLGGAIVNEPGIRDPFKVVIAALILNIVRFAHDG